MTSKNEAIDSLESVGTGALPQVAPPRMTGEVQRGKLALMSVTHVVNDFYAGAVPALIPFMVLERNYTYAAASAIMLAANLLGSVLQPAFGLLVDRWRIPWLAVVGFLIAGVGVGISGLTQDLLLTCLAVAGTGLGVAAYHPSATRQAKAASGPRTSGLAVFSVGGNIGMALAPLAVSLVIGNLGLAATPLLALPAVALALLMAIWRGVERAKRARSGVAAPSPTKPARQGKDDWRAFGWFSAMVILSSAGSAGIQAFLALFLISEFGVSTEFGAGSLTLFTGMGVLGTLAGGWLADRIGHILTLRLGYLIGPLALGVMLLAPGTVVALIAIAVLGFAAFIPFSVQVALGMKYLPNRIGTSSGLTLGLGATVGGLFAPVYGILADGHGLRFALTVGLGVKVLALAMTFLLKKPDES
ncbi:FSR family fosmidomycin resistance protein-like MFS transporter [Mycetocola sp. BIGb0189]|uniref:MFS transporter n=1 Tax=Mycetocola sp. BIGb0189 TaxID=2940604 RepID=UPI002168D48A|nr:MFS transporter [Mycetocola sp. BIGb0189]MCS4277525.1 FSR family fosmidomycin resistance protein-like MFS transporter [Mycetocola sp. BIGb0189]